MRVSFATGWWQRFRGLAHPKFGGTCGTLLIAPCRSIHTFTMKRPIDVAFIDREGRVCRIHMALPPRRLLFCRRACAVLERPVSTRIPSGPAPGSDWLRVGDWLDLGSCGVDSGGIAGVPPDSGFDGPGEGRLRP
jgi:uncharacterized membrane protein (UPF0127 family)